MLTISYLKYMCSPRSCGSSQLETVEAERMPTYLVKRKYTRTRIISCCYLLYVYYIANLPCENLTFPNTITSSPLPRDEIADTLTTYVVPGTSGESVTRVPLTVISPESSN